MKFIARAGCAASVGLAASAIGYFGGEAITFSAEEYNPRVEACAGQLGVVATEATELPKPCNDLQQDSTYGVFAYKETTVRVYDPARDVSNTTTEKKVYTLPSADAFRADQLITDEDEATTREFHKDTALLYGGIGALLMFGALTYSDKMSRRPQLQPEG